MDRETKARRLYPLKRGIPPDRKEGLPMVTYSDLIQLCIFIVALIGLVYKISKDVKK